MKKLFLSIIILFLTFSFLYSRSFTLDCSSKFYYSKIKKEFSKYNTLSYVRMTLFIYRLRIPETRNVDEIVRRLKKCAIKGYKRCIEAYNRMNGLDFLKTPSNYKIDTIKMIDRGSNYSICECEVYFKNPKTGKLNYSGTMKYKVVRKGFLPKFEVIEWKPF